MADFYVSSTGWASVNAWSSGTSVSLGQIVRQLATPTQGNERCWRCTTAGTTGGAEPTWTLTANSTTNDNGVVWTECTGQEAYQGTSGDFQAPYASVNEVIRQGGRGSAGFSDRVFIAHTHVDEWSTARDWAAGGANICIDVSARNTLPPTGEHVGYGAILRTTGTSTMTLAGTLVWQGIIFECGTSGAANMLLGRTALRSIQRMIGCRIRLLGGSTQRIQLGNTSTGDLNLEDTVVEFSNAGQTIYFNLQGSSLSWFNTASAIVGTSPTELLDANTNIGIIALIEGVDLSGCSGTLINLAGGTSSNFSQAAIRHCLLNSGATLTAGFRMRGRANFVEIANCSWSGGFPGNGVVGSGTGSSVAQNTFYRDGGATLNTTPWAYRLNNSDQSGGSGSRANHLITPWMMVYYDDPGVAVTVNVECVVVRPSAVDQNVLWLEVGYMAASGHAALTVVEDDPPLLPLASPASIAASIAEWVGPARLDSTAYSPSNGFTVATAAGLLFFNIDSVSRTTASSEPAGYATVVDGDAISDGTGTFRTGRRLTLQKTITPQRAGYIFVRVHLADDENNNTVRSLAFVCPAIDLT